VRWNEMHSAIVEPVFEHIKVQRCFLRLSPRGKQNVRREWELWRVHTNNSLSDRLIMDGDHARVVQEDRIKSAGTTGQRAA